MRIVKTVCIAVLIAGLASASFAEEAGRSAKIMDIEGEATVRLLGEKKWIPAETGMILKEGDSLKTKADSWMLVEIYGLENTASVELEEDTQLLLLRLEESEGEGTKTEKTLLDLPIGEILLKVEKLPAESEFEVKTPSSVAGVRGTSFSIKVEAVE